MSYSLFQGNDIARVASWLIGVLGILGNILMLLDICKIKTIILRSKVNPASISNKVNFQKSPKVTGFLVCNLAIADIIGCIYLTIVAAADAYYGYRYPTIYQVIPSPVNTTNIWVLNPFCYIARYAFFTSSIASLFITMLIAIDRFIVVLFPYSSARLNLSKCKILMTLVWIFLCSFGGIGFSIGLPNIPKASKLFTFTSNLCMNIADIQQFGPFLIARQTIYYASCGIIMLCYSIIIAYIRSKKTKVSKQMNVIERRIFIMMLIITATNVFSLVPATVLFISASFSAAAKSNISFESNGSDLSAISGWNASSKWNTASFSPTLFVINESSNWQPSQNLQQSQELFSLYPTKISLTRFDPGTNKEYTKSRSNTLSSFNGTVGKQEAEVKPFKNSTWPIVTAIIMSYINAAINPIIYFCFSWSINHRKWCCFKRSNDSHITVHTNLYKYATESNISNYIQLKSDSQIIGNTNIHKYTTESNISNYTT